MRKHETRSALDLAFEDINLLQESVFPADYHTQQYAELYRGQLLRGDGVGFAPYSARDRKKFYSPDERHVCPGHYQGYRFVIANFSPAGGMVFDPFMGTGTTACESMRLGRRAIGTELQFASVARTNIEYTENYFGSDIISRYGSIPKAEILEGDARELLPQVTERLAGIGGADLIVTGPPYPGKSDVPEGGMDYNRELSNFAILKEGEYWQAMKTFVAQLPSLLNDSGKLVFIVKDLIANKKNILLHKFLAECAEPIMQVTQVYLHLHWPPTMFISTYNKAHPDAELVPRYQTIVVMEKS